MTGKEWRFNTIDLRTGPACPSRSHGMLFLDKAVCRIAYGDSSGVPGTVGYTNAVRTASAAFTADLSKGPLQFFLPLPDFLNLTSVVFHTVTAGTGSPQQQLVVDDMVIGVSGPLN